MRIFHIATAADWSAAQTTGEYTTSTRGRSLAEEGFIHASRGDQWQAVRQRYYADVDEPLVLLAIDPARLSAPVVDEPPTPGAEETFPHVYGPIEVAAVVSVVPMTDRPSGAPTGEPASSFSRLFLEELFRRVALAGIAMVAVVAASGLGALSGWSWGAIAGAALGLVVGVLAARAVARRRGW